MRASLAVLLLVAPVAAAAVPDLAVVAVHARYSGPSTLDVTWTYANLGDVRSEPSEVLLEYHASGAWHPLGTRAVPALDPGAERAMSASSCHGPVRTLGALDVRVTVDPEARLADGDRSNDRATTTVGEGMPFKAVQTPVTFWCPGG